MADDLEIGGGAEKKSNDELRIKGGADPGLTEVRGPGTKKSRLERGAEGARSLAEKFGAGVSKISKSGGDGGDGGGGDGGGRISGFADKVADPDDFASQAFFGDMGGDSGGGDDAEMGNDEDLLF
jgi:hypothetical protein